MRSEAEGGKETLAKQKTGAGERQALRLIENGGEPVRR
jgi:hypothetical protein